MSETSTVYGESAAAILRTLANADVDGPKKDGMRTFHLEMTPVELGPFVRALMRAEAELLLQEADAFRPGAPMPSGEERRATALLTLVLAAAAAAPDAADDSGFADFRSARRPSGGAVSRR